MGVANKRNSYAVSWLEKVLTAINHTMPGLARFILQNCDRLLQKIALSARGFDL